MIKGFDQVVKDPLIVNIISYYYNNKRRNNDKKICFDFHVFRPIGNFDNICASSCKYKPSICYNPPGHSSTNCNKQIINIHPTRSTVSSNLSPIILTSYYPFLYRCRWCMSCNLRPSPIYLPCDNASSTGLPALLLVLMILVPFLFMDSDKFDYIFSSN